MKNLSSGAETVKSIGVPLQQETSATAMLKGQYVFLAVPFEHVPRASTAGGTAIMQHGIAQRGDPSAERTR
jgi:hypothetical protein